MVEQFGFGHSVQKNAGVAELFSPLMGNHSFVSVEAHKPCGSIKDLNIQSFVVLLCLEELYGDFEDLETGKVHKGQTGQQDQAEVGPVYVINMIYH